MFAHEQNVVSSRMDAQRAKAISTIYAAMCSVFGPLVKLVAGSPIVNATPEMHVSFYEDVAETGHEAGRALLRVLLDNAIYVSNDTYTTIGDYAAESSEAIARLLSPIRAGRANGSPAASILAKVEQQRKKLQKLHEDTLLPLAQKVTFEFRLLIGVEC